jgi:trigger factor
MKVTETTIEGCQALLTIELDTADMQEAMENAYQRLVKKTEVPGFRKGKTPRPILERYIGKDRLIEESLDEVLPKACSAAIKEQDLKSFGTPGVEILQNDPVIFKAKVPLPPKVELGDYKSIRLSPEPVEVSEEIITNMIRQIRHEKATWEPVERPVKDGDLAVMDMESNIDGTPFVNQKGVQIGINLESGYPAPGFSEALIGLKAGDEKEFKLRYPDDFAKPELAGKEPGFKIKVHEVKEENMPPEDDEFAKSIDVAEIQTFAELKERMTDNYRKQLENSAEGKFESKLVDELVKVSTAEFPSNLVDMEYERLVNQQLDRWQQQVGSEEEYRELLARVNPEDLARQLRPQAEERVRRSLILGQLATAEAIEVTEEEINAEIEVMLSGIPEDQREAQRPGFEGPEARDEINQIILSRKTMARLKELAGQDAGETPEAGDVKKPVKAAAKKAPAKKTVKKTEKAVEEKEEATE